MTTIIESEHRPQHASDAASFGLADHEIVELFAANRLMGFYRQDLLAGHLYFCEQACALYGIAPTTGPVNLIEVLSKIHKDDIEVMLLTLEERARLGKGAHYIFRIADGADDHRYVRIISAYRDNGTPAGEVAGLVYAFFDRIPAATFDKSGIVVAASAADGTHIGLSDAEITGLLQTYQRIGYFRQEAAGGLFLSGDACGIIGIDVVEGSVGVGTIVSRLHPDDVGLVTATFAVAARDAAGFDLICRVQRETSAAKFIRMIGKYRRGASGEGEIAGLVYEFFERMQIVDFGDE